MSTSSYHSLVTSYANQTTTHGVRRISSSRHPGRKIFWTIVFLTSLAGCCYHCSYLISSYIANPKVTITEEKDADMVEFPSVTICNLNVIKKSFADAYFEMDADDDDSEQNSSKRATCFGSEQELANKSAIDLSDIWMNLGVTKDNLSRYGHQAADLIIQCTYNSVDCFNSKNFRTVITNVTSPLFGLCHIISLRNKKAQTPIKIKKSGTTNGIRLTLNIEREQYWNLVSSEYGVRILVHPQGSYPTLQRGGMIISPGRSIHIGVKRKVSELLPGWEGTCTENFEALMAEMSTLGLSFDLSDLRYTYEHCNALCQNAMLFNSCGCLDEQPKASSKTGWKFCNPCDEDQAACRSQVLKNITESTTTCDDVCKPSCKSIRYDISLSKADWPILKHQKFVMNRSRAEWMKVSKSVGLRAFTLGKDNIEYVNGTFFSENLLRVHVFFEDMLYTFIQERYSYTLPKLMADLGGCLGLYLGVSVISIIELVELFGNASIICLRGIKNHSKIQSSTFSRSGSRKRRRKRTGNTTVGSYTSNFRTSLGFPKKKKNQRNETVIWRPPFAAVDPYYDEDRRNYTIRQY